MEKKFFGNQEVITSKAHFEQILKENPLNNIVYAVGGRQPYLLKELFDVNVAFYNPQKILHRGDMDDFILMYGQFSLTPYEASK